jgi:RimJ/RimL family protein N-acetyltransferase
MKYRKTIRLKDGRSCCLRNATEEDAQAMLDVFNLTHMQTDFLLTYPGEGDMTADSEAAFLRDATASDNAIEILADVDGVVAGSAGIEPVGSKHKLRHRAEFGISIDERFWHLGIGRALTKACVECARTAGYSQLELDVVVSNEHAIALYQDEGFVEYGRNPRGFRLRSGAYQELVLMRLELG